jgi:CheY-like chemotaxis protein
MNTTNQHYAVSHHIPCILIIEDDADDRILLKIAFDRITENFSLHFVSSAQEAMDYLQSIQDRQLPHLIVTDYNLPTYNGLRLIQHLNTVERFQGIKKVILSSLLYFPGFKNVNNHAVRCFVKPDTFDKMKQLAELLLHLCPNEENVSTECIQL